MGIKKSVMLSDTTVRFIESRTPTSSDMQWSQSINTAFNLLDYILIDSLPVLSERHWNLIFNTYNGHFFESDYMPLRISSDIMDAHAAVDLSELPPGIAEIVSDIHKLSQTEQVAVMHIAQKFWSGQHQADLNNCADLLACVALLAGDKKRNGRERVVMDNLLNPEARR